MEFAGLLLRGDIVGLNQETMKSYEYKTLRMKTKFRSSKDVTEMDRVINESAAKGWELVTTTTLSSGTFSDGKTNGMLLTFRRETKAATN